MRLTLLLTATLFLSLPSFGQGSPVPGPRAVVCDSTGHVYPALVWQRMIRELPFKVEAENPADPKTAFRIFPMKGAERDARMEAMPRPAPSKFFRTGEPIDLPDLKDIDGRELNLSTARGKIVVINFWFTTCGPCQAEISDLNALVDSFGARGDVIFVGMALDSAAALRKFLKKRPFRYAAVEAKWEPMMSGVYLFPTHLVVDAEGRVFYHSSGYTYSTVYWVEKAIRNLLRTM